MTDARTADSVPTAAARPVTWPGLLLAVGGAAAAMGIRQLAPTVSPLLGAILLGAALANLASLRGGLPAVLAPGLAVASRRLLRLGVVLLGLQLGIGEVLALGWPVVVGVVAIVGLTMAGTLGAGRLLGVGQDQSLLIASGFSICGAAAVAGVEGVLPRRRPEETAAAVALVVLFGTAMIAVMPALTGALGLDQHLAGIWVGGTTHEVAQVVAAAGIIGPAALSSAVVVKLARVLLLAPVLVAISWQQRGAAAGEGRTLPPLVPLFVAGFAAMVAIRSLGVVPDQVLAVAQVVQSWLLAAAMFALGTSVHWQVVRRTGGRPVLLAAIATGVAIAIAGLVTWLASVL